MLYLHFLQPEIQSSELDFSPSSETSSSGVWFRQLEKTSQPAANSRSSPRRDGGRHHRPKCGEKAECNTGIVIICKEGVMGIHSDRLSQPVYSWENSLEEEEKQTQKEAGGILGEDRKSDGVK